MLCLDAPVSGGDIGARQGTLTIMVGGPQEALEKVMPVLLAEGKTITHIGSAGTGQIAKAANQIMVAAQMVAMAELLIFSQKAGADPVKVVEAIRGGAAQCWTLDVKPPRLFQEQSPARIQSLHASERSQYHYRNRAQYRIPRLCCIGCSTVQRHAPARPGRAGQLGA